MVIGFINGLKLFLQLTILNQVLSWLWKSIKTENKSVQAKREKSQFCMSQRHLLRLWSLFTKKIGLNHRSQHCWND